MLFSSFDPAALGRLRARSGAAALAVLWEHAGIAEALQLAERVGARALHLRKDVVSDESLKESARAGLPVRAWTVNDPGEMARLRASGVDGIFTDFPERFLHSRMPE